MGQFDGVELDDLVLTGARLTLRPWRPEDADAVHAIMQDPAMHAYLALPRPYRPEDAQDYVARFAPAQRAAASALEAALTATDTGELVGSAALRLPRPAGPTADIGYWVAPAAQGRGYATEATRVLAAWGLAHGLRRIEVHCDVRNLGSARTALAAGFRFEGVARAGIAATDGRHDLATFARLDSDPGDPVPLSYARLPAGGLSDGVVRLRATEPDDAAALVEQENDPLTVANGFTGVAPPTDDIERLCARAGLDWLVARQAPFTMVDEASGRFAGSLVLRYAGPPGVGGIGYAVHPAFRGRGVAARALRILAPWAFETARFARLELGAKTDNLASQRAAQSGGFEPDAPREARLRSPDGTYSDEARFVLINPAVRAGGPP
jgi:RimJ/RimL family protein N-acetyltransferase